MLVPASVKADEGIWFLMFIERLNHPRHAKNGLVQLTAERNLQYQQPQFKRCYRSI